MFSTKYPYVMVDNRTYETDNIHILLEEQVDSPLWTLLFTRDGFYFQWTSVLTYTFKNGPITPAILQLVFKDWNKSGTPELYVDYLINDEWITKVTYPIPASGIHYSEVKIELVPEPTKKIRIRLGGIGTMTECNILFTTESPMIKNKVANVIMQNEFFQSVLPKMEVE